jgi:hypothetical protein
MKHEYTKKARGKGWTLRELAVEFGCSVRMMSKTARSPKRKDWLALKALPDRRNK